MSSQLELFDSVEKDACRACGVMKDLGAFPLKKSSRNGIYYRRHICRDCVMKRKRERYHSNEKVRAGYIRRAHKNYWRDPERARAQKKDYYERNREQAKENARRWYWSNRERALHYSRQYYRKNRERLLRYHRDYNQANSERRVENARRWARENPERARLHGRIKAHRRRRRLLRHPFHHTARDIRRLLHQQRGECALCGDGLSDGYHVDHIIPVVRGGHNGVGNIQLLCPPCNIRKGANLMAEVRY